MTIERVYHILLGLYPLDYRTCFASEMVTTFEEAAKERRQQGMFGSAHFAVTELLGLLLGAAAEWLAKLSTDPSRRGRCLPDLRMMRPPGVARKRWFARTDAADPQAGVPANAIAVQSQIAAAIGQMTQAIANHDFPKARFYSDRERQLRAHLSSLE